MFHLSNSLNYPVKKPPGAFRPVPIDELHRVHVEDVGIAPVLLVPHYPSRCLYHLLEGGHLVPSLAHLILMPADPLVTEVLVGSLDYYLPPCLVIPEVSALLQLYPKAMD